MHKNSFVIIISGGRKDMGLWVNKEEQMSFIKYDLAKIVEEGHELKQITRIINFKPIALRFKEILKDLGRKGYGLELGIKALFLQFYYDLSDRQLEKRLRYDLSFRWFCGLTIDDEVPDHSYFCRIRKRLGTERVAEIFRKIKKRAKKAEILRGVFSFVDSGEIKTKETIWEERDKALKAEEETLNNKNVDKYSADKDARFGCKGKNKFWFGYKRHVSVDMGSGLIDKIAVTPANVTDQAGLKHVCPDGGMVFADKQYCCKQAQITLKFNGCHSGVILKNNMKNKNKDKDRWIAKMRAPFEMVFSKMSKRARYRGLAKVQMQAFWEAIVFNVRRLIVINSPPLFAGA